MEALAARTVFCGVALPACTSPRSLTRRANPVVQVSAVATPSLPMEPMHMREVGDAPGKLYLDSLISKLEGKARRAASAAAEKVLKSPGACAAKPLVASALFGEKQASMRAWWAEQLARRASASAAVMPEAVCDSNEDEDEDEDKLVFRMGPPKCVSAHEAEEDAEKRLLRQWHNPTSDPQRQ